jgi:hypothetical protein
VVGKSYAVSVTMQNTSGITWTAGQLFRLGSQDPQDNTIWGLGRVELPGPVAPGQQVTFNFTVTAPANPGTYNFRWRMVQDGVQWFGSLKLPPRPTRAPTTSGGAWCRTASSGSAP